jgi:hypothetical protein
MRHIQVFILFTGLIYFNLNSAAQTSDSIIANWEDVIPVPGAGSGVWQYFISGGSSEIIANPVPDEINPTQNVLAFYRPAGEWLLAGFYYQDGIQVTKQMTGIEFKIFGNNLAKCYVKLIGIADGISDQTIIENAWPWTAPSGAKVWNTIMLQIDGNALLNDTLTTLLIFPNPQLPEAAQDTFYIDEVRFLLTIPVDSIILNINDTTLEQDESVYLEAAIYPENASNQDLSWMSINTSVATVSSIGKVQAKGPGSTNIIVRTEDGNKTDTCRITVNDAEGIAETHAKLLRIYPNPYQNGKLIIILPESSNSEVRLTIFNLLGETILTFSIPETGDRVSIQPELQNGIYLIKVETVGNIWHGRIIKG